MQQKKKKETVVLVWKTYRTSDLKSKYLFETQFSNKFIIKAESDSSLKHDQVEMLPILKYRYYFNKKFFQFN